jgi:hypothetical protein
VNPIPYQNRLDVFRCESCNHLTTRQETGLRTFDTGYCGCGGNLISVEDENLAENILHEARKSYKRLTGRWPR